MNELSYFCIVQIELIVATKMTNLHNFVQFLDEKNNITASI
jgi:hypothetical protein